MKSLFNISSIPFGVVSIILLCLIGFLAHYYQYGHYSASGFIGGYIVVWLYNLYRGKKNKK